MNRRLTIQRWDPARDRDSQYDRWEIEVEPQERVLDALNRIKWTKDGSLSFRQSCAHGVCGSCAVRINGRCALACQTLIGTLTEGEILIEPLPHFRVLKDLIVDLDPFFERVARVRPFLISLAEPSAGERLQSPGDRRQIDQVIRCILCATCVGACPTLDDHPAFLGPAPLVQAFRQVFDSRDEARDSRLAQLDDPDGVWGCVNKFECTRVCPKEIPVTKSINQIKRALEKAGPEDPDPPAGPKD
jgi:succinate dehydrogenase / fumarate reductase iron-sulfur subunit